MARTPLDYTGGDKNNLPLALGHVEAALVELYTALGNGTSLDGAVARAWLDAAPTTHGHAISAITGLTAALDGKATSAQGAKADTAVQPGAEISVLIETATAKILTNLERAKLAAIAEGAQVNPSAADIKAAYESNANTNAFTDSLKARVEAETEVSAPGLDTVLLIAADGAALTATVHPFAISGTEVAPKADSIGNTHLANVASGTVKARLTAGTGDPEDVTLAALKTAMALESEGGGAELDGPTRAKVRMTASLKLDATTETLWVEAPAAGRLFYLANASETATESALLASGTYVDFGAAGISDQSGAITWPAAGATGFLHFLFRSTTGSMTGLVTSLPYEMPAAASAPAVRSFTGVAASFATSRTVNVTGAVSGDKIFGVAIGNGAFTFSTPAGWTKIEGDISFATDVTSYAVFEYTAGGTPPTTFVATKSAGGSTNIAAASIVVAGGAGAIKTAITPVAQTGADFQYDGASIAAVDANSLLLHLIMHRNPLPIVTIEGPAGFPDETGTMPTFASPEPAGRILAGLGKDYHTNTTPGLSLLWGTQEAAGASAVAQPKWSLNSVYCCILSIAVEPS
jgi:hypothetical protein